MEDYKLDAMDRQILSSLVKDARTPFLEIARKCGVSGAAIHQRVKKLETLGIITGYTTQVKPSSLGLPICAYIDISISQADRLADVVSRLKKIPEVVECHFVTGDSTMLLKVYCASYDHLMEVIVNNINKIEAVKSTQTKISLGEAFERQVYVHQELPTITWKG